MGSRDTASPSKLDRCIAKLYGELHDLAERRMRRERAGHTLQATALVNEVFLQLADQHQLASADKEAFLRQAAGIARRVLVDHARAHTSQKRGGDRLRVTLDEHVAEVTGDGLDLLALEEALVELEQLDGEQALVVELRFFASMTWPEVAKATGLSLRTVQNRWETARAFLHATMAEGDGT